MYPNDRKLDVSLDQPNMRTTPVPLCTDVEGTVSYLIHLSLENQQINSRLQDISSTLHFITKKGLREVK